jgi:iron complex transport system permease protein
MKLSFLYDETSIIPNFATNSDAMKVTLDLDQLKNEGRITAEEYNRLRKFAAEATVSLALNLFLAIGIAATTGGLLALLHSAAAATIIGLSLAAAGGFFCWISSNSWKLLSRILLWLGELITGGGILFLTEGRTEGFLFAGILFFAGGLSVRSGSMAALSSFMFLGALGGMTGYMRAMYFLCVEQPTLTIAVFAIMSAIAGAIGNRLPIRFSRPVKSFAASAFVIVNLAFWIGSLWGDRSRFGGESAMVFVVTWALFLVFLVAWAAFTHRRWVVTTGTVFAVIHLYTQWFERLSLSPGSVMLAGILVIFIAAGLITYLRRPSVEIGG